MFYFSLVAFSVVNLLSALLRILPHRVYALLGHVFLFNTQMPKYAKWWFWFAILPFKIIDVLLIPQLVNILFTIVKVNSRQLTETEITEAKKVFKNTLPYRLITIDEHSFFAWLGSKFNSIKYLGVVSFYHINFNRKLNCCEHNYDMGWLIHELTHVLQFKKLGSSYIFYALYAQQTTGYGLGDIKNKILADFNFEQQAEIARFYYENISNEGTNKYSFFMGNILNSKFI